MYKDISDFNNLLTAYRLARRDNRYKSSTCKFDLFLEDNLFRLKWELETDRYFPSPYAYFVITDPKMRHVVAPNFRDRVVHHGLVSVIEPIFEKTFIYDAFACRKDKGTHFGAKRTKKFLQAARSFHGKDAPLYVLQCDIQRFFPSISWGILIELINKKIDCPKIRDLIVRIITTHKVFYDGNILRELPKEIISSEERKGLPIGNLTSQLFANIYLNPLDHFVKETLKERWYGRYMDDFFIISSDNKHLLEVREKIRQFLLTTLNLTLHPRKSIIQNVKNGVPFVGYRIFYDHTLIRGSTLQRFQRRLREKKLAMRHGKISESKLLQIQQSFAGHLNYANTWGLRQSMSIY